MTLYNIYWHDGFGNRDYVATTNNLDKWLEFNNKHRIKEGNEPEELEDFEIVETDSFIFKETIVSWEDKDGNEFILGEQE